MFDLLLLTLQARHSFSAETRALKPVKVADALVELPETWKRMVVAGDFNGDGRPEVALEHYGVASRAIEIVSTCDGTTVRTLWSRRPKPRTLEIWSWDLGDVDGDDVPDLILGLPAESTDAFTSSGVVVLVSGATGAELRRVEGSHAYEGWGAAVVHVGDTDHDGFGD